GAVFTSRMLMKRIADRTASEVRDAVTLAIKWKDKVGSNGSIITDTFQPPQVTTQESVSQVEKDGHSANMETPTYRGKLLLVGEPWKWTASKGKGTTADGKVVE